MNNIKFEQLIYKHHATTDLKRFAMLKNWEQFYNECHRADWLLWLYYETQTSRDNEIILNIVQSILVLILITQLEAPEVTAIFKNKIYADSMKINEKQFKYIQRYYYECTGKDERLQYINKQLIDRVKKSLPIEHWKF